MEAEGIKTASTSTTSSSCTPTATSSDKMNYALQVALQTMKERCIQLQRRVSSMEEENRRVRDGSAYLNASNQGQSGQADCNNDVLSIRAQVDELQRQKEQLEDQINMVSDENRRLWSRLSKISKDQTQLTKDDDLMFTSHNTRAGAAANGSNSANQNLIRSKTFTQHTPNPLLRQKMITETSTDTELDGSNGLGYPYGLQVEDLDTNIDDDKNSMEGLQELRREALKQQQGLNSVITLLKARSTALQPCPSCAQKDENKPEMADKSLETEERLGNEQLKRYLNEHTAIQVPESAKEPATAAPSLPTPARLNLIQEKQKADAADKTCPMCGKLYSSEVSFKAFQEHVEMHFIDESLDMDASMDRQFEFISHAVGDF